MDTRTPQTDLVALPAAPRKETYLVVEAGSRRRLKLGARPVQVGSSPDHNDLVVCDPTVSAQHFRLEPSFDGWVIRDLQSRNGTWVEGLAVEVARIRCGARVRIGRTNLRLEHGEKDDVTMIAESSEMKRVLAEARRYARVCWPALVVGPSGSGKEGIARTLHRAGPRASGPYVAVNAGGLPRNLVESELFGHEKGAFTGADLPRRGVFEQAHGGTLFLDEIGELPLDLQSRLLRVLETGEVRRVGAEKAVEVDVRVVGATHRDLVALVHEGRFREDLYFRLSRLLITVPGLAERPADIPALAVHFLKSVEDEVGPRRLSEPAIQRLLAHRWVGNARELRNVVTSAALCTPSEVIQASDVERQIVCLSPRCAPPPLEALEEVVARHGGNMAAAARALGLPRSTLRDRLKGVKRATPKKEETAEVA
jgi:DNA-binding NtrC family response regulator